MNKTERELLELGLALAAVWFGTEILKGLSTKCPRCGSTIQGKPLTCPRCGALLGWEP